ncbi:MAG: DNA/RNA non-specific endonuclease [Oscillospiraceae bacterium]|nr:DNA/RNA non-specific endonuclease [Oscillospiraceae bacterium]
MYSGEIPEYTGSAYVAIEDNTPLFRYDEITTRSYEFYSELDELGRCGYAMACIGEDLMPTENRESISAVKPSGWNQAEYDFVDGKMLYNRCHLIGFQLTGENANEKNLITGTRYLNVQGMLPFENMVADYIKETGNHVMYRVTPVYSGDEPVARGVRMEAYSVEDQGDGITFHVYVFNIQPGVGIDYTDGSSKLDNSVKEQITTEEMASGGYVLNVKSKKFHSADCGQADSISDGNKERFDGDRDTLINQGYEPAGCCNP